MNKHIDVIGTKLEELKSEPYYLDYFQNQEPEIVTGDYYLTNEERGIEFVFDKNQLLVNVHLYGANHPEASMCIEQLPFEITFQDSYEVVSKKIGKEPSEQGGGEQLAFLGMTNLWYKFQFETYYLHVEMNTKNEVYMLTIGA